MDRTAAAVSCFTEDPSTSVRNQYIAAIIVCLGTFSYGSSLGWLSPSLEVLQGPSSPLGAPLTIQEVSAVASLFCAGGLLGSLAAGLLADWLGRWWTGLILAIPCALCWILKLTANSAMMIYFARILAGFGGGGSLLLDPMYSLEIASLGVRGSLGSVTMLAVNAGVLFSFVIGAFLSYEAVLWVHLSVPVIYIVGFFFMPETPTFLVKREKYEEAARAIAWLRNTSTEDPVTVGVLENLKQEALLASKSIQNSGTTLPTSDYVYNEKTMGTIQPINLSNKDIPDWKFFITSQATLKAFGMCIVIIIIHVWVGVFAILSYVSEIFVDAGSTLSPNNAAVVVGALQFFGTCVSIVLVDRIGRKVLFILSCVILGLALATLGTYFFFSNRDYEMSSVAWIPVAAVSLGVFMEAVGVGPIPFVILNEVFMVQAQGIAVTIISIWLWLMLFLQTQFYKAAEDALGSDGIFWAFSAVCAFGAVFTAFLVPETRGKTLDEILQHFDGRSSKKTVKAGTDNIAASRFTSH